MNEYASVIAAISNRVKRNKAGWWIKSGRFELTSNKDSVYLIAVRAGLATIRSNDFATVASCK
jgi:hypothetical protein